MKYNHAKKADKPMKNKFTLIGLCLFISFNLASCNNEATSISIVNKYKASFESNGGSIVASFYADVIESSPLTTRANYDFEGWFIDKELSNKATFPYAMIEDTTFYAKWSIKEANPIGINVVSAKVDKDEAKAYVTGEYKDNLLSVVVNVKDDKVFNSLPSSPSGELNGYNDNFEIYVSPLSNQNSGFDVTKTYRILSVPVVGFNVFKINNDKTFESSLVSDTGISKTNEKIYTRDLDGFNGYGASINIPYSLLGLKNKEEAMENMGVYFALRNSNGMKNKETKYEESNYLGSCKEDAWTYLNFDETGNLVRKKVDSVIFGDSYVDSDFYRNFNIEFNGTSLYGSNKSNSKVEEWMNEDNKMYERITKANPNKVFIHLGTNDIQADLGVEATVKNLNTLFNKIYESNNNVRIYWMSSPYNFSSPNRYNELIGEVKVGVEALSLPYLTIKDGNDFTDNERSSFLADGFHYNLFTYAKVSNWIKKQLDESLVLENNLFGTSKDNMDSSPQIDLTNDEQISSKGNLDTFAFVKDSGNDCSFTFNTKMKIAEVNNNDPYSKFGIILKYPKSIDKDDSCLYFIYIDNSIVDKGKVGVATYHCYGDIPGASWQFNYPKKEISGPLDSKYEYNSDFIDLRLVKSNSSISFYAGDMINPILSFEGYEGKTSVGIMSFNLPFIAKDSSYIN